MMMMMIIIKLQKRHNSVNLQNIKNSIYGFARNLTGHI